MTFRKISRCTWNGSGSRLADWELGELLVVVAVRVCAGTAINEKFKSRHQRSHLYRAESGTIDQANAVFARASDLALEVWAGGSPGFGLGVDGEVEAFFAAEGTRDWGVWAQG